MLEDLGWNEALAAHFASHASDGLIAGRVIREDRGAYTVVAEQGELAAAVSGRFRHEAQEKGDFPGVGDWVAMEPVGAEQKAIIHAVLPRRGAFVRQDPGAQTQRQVVAANVDLVFLVSGLDGDFNLRRIERYLAAAWDGGAKPIIVLNKADICADVADRMEKVESVAFGAPILLVSAATGEGLEALRAQVHRGMTVAFLGMSGVGKSSLINALLGEARQAVSDVRADDSRGRHTTTRRELIVLPTGGLVVDTPGMRELGLWVDEASVDRAFSDIEALAVECRFSDCQHEAEPGCAVQRAIAEGALDAGRLRSFRKLKREIEHLEARQQQKTRLLEKTRWKKIAQWQRQIKKSKG